MRVSWDSQNGERCHGQIPRNNAYLELLDGIAGVSLGVVAHSDDELQLKQQQHEAGPPAVAIVLDACAHYCRNDLRGHRGIKSIRKRQTKGIQLPSRRAARSRRHPIATAICTPWDAATCSNSAADAISRAPFIIMRALVTTRVSPRQRGQSTMRAALRLTDCWDWLYAGAFLPMRLTSRLNGKLRMAGAGIAQSV